MGDMHSWNSVPYSRPFMHKSRGWQFLNGNIEQESQLIEMFAEQILAPRHSDPVVNNSRKVLLITAAFNRGQEHNDRHLIHLFERLNINADWDDHFPRNIQNLSIYSMFTEFKEQESWLYRRYTEKQDSIKAVKRDYYEKIVNYVDRINQLRGQLKEKFKGLTLFDFYYSERIRDNVNFFLMNLSGAPRQRRLRALSKLVFSTGDMAHCLQLRHLIEHLNYLDEQVFNTCAEIEGYFLEHSGISQSSLYHEQHEELVRRILSSASIFLFGGRVFVLMNRLRFYQLSPAFEAALDRGTNLYGISAGSICQTYRYSLSFNRAGSAGDIIAADIGLGLTKGVRIFPHANDIHYIMKADRDELSFFALRHREVAVIGLREKSVLLVEKYCDPIDGKLYKRFSSVGQHPVMIFGERGERVDLGYEDQIFMEGCKFFHGIVQTATKNDVDRLETAWRLNRANRLVEQLQDDESVRSDHYSGPPVPPS